MPFESILISSVSLCLRLWCQTSNLMWYYHAKPVSDSEPAVQPILASSREQESGDHDHCQKNNNTDNNSIDAIKVGMIETDWGRRLQFRRDSSAFHFTC